MVKGRNAYDLIGCCGLFCGLCNKFQSSAPSRCIGCQKGEQHSWCSIWNCCVKKHGYTNCTECIEIYNCKIFKRRKVEEWIPAAENLRQIQRIGIEGWLNEQIERQELVEELMQKYNEGRSASLFCMVSSRMSIMMIKRAVDDTESEMLMRKINRNDKKAKAKIMRTIINRLAGENGITLK